MDWLGLGKHRSKFGKSLDDNGISQQDLADKSGISKSTVGRLCGDDSAQPNWQTRKKLMKALRQYDGEMSADDFWD